MNLVDITLLMPPFEGDRTKKIKATGIISVSGTNGATVITTKATAAASTERAG